MNSISFDKDYYGILGVSKDASKEEIKKSYKNLAMKLHPDRTKGNKEAEERFKEAAEANEVLTKPEMRQQYDASSPFGKNRQRTQNHTPNLDDILDGIMKEAFQDLNKSQTPPTETKNIWGEYINIKYAAWNAYEHKSNAAWKEYTHKKDVAWEEYASIKNDAWDRYQKGELDFKEFSNVDTLAYREFSNVDTLAYREFSDIKARAYREFDNINAQAYKKYKRGDYEWLRSFRKDKSM